MLFRLGSTTKMFTATALVSLAEEGKIKLDDPIGLVVRGLDPKIAAVTAHQLLTHTSGFLDEAPMYGSQDEGALEKEVKSWREDHFFTIFPATPPLFPFPLCFLDRMSCKFAGTHRSASPAPNRHDFAGAVRITHSDSDTACQSSEYLWNHKDLKARLALGPLRSLRFWWFVLGMRRHRSQGRVALSELPYNPVC
jgi:hypothetical protein